MNAPAGSPKRILLVYDRVFASFIARDWGIVSKRWPESVCFGWRGWRDLPRLGYEAAKSDLVFCWFGAAHALASVWATAGRQPVVITAGGWDVARLPEIHYGAHVSPLLHQVSKIMFARAARVFAVSEFTRSEALRHAGVAPEKLFTVNHGFDQDAWPPASGSRPLDVVTVSGTYPLVKGLDLVKDTAARMKDVRFEVVGPKPAGDVWGNLSDYPANVTFTGLLPGPAFRDKLRRAKVCFQPSRQESFCCAVAEAMLCGCVPVVARRGALPEVVGDAGHVVDWMLPAEFDRAIRRALDASEEDRAKARQRIVETYPMDAYARNLVSLLEELL